MGKSLTTGRLDGLTISPIVDGGEIRFLDFTVDTLPGLRLVVEAGAARELRDALDMILSERREPDLKCCPRFTWGDGTHDPCCKAGPAPVDCGDHACMAPEHAGCVAATLRCGCNECLAAIHERALRAGMPPSGRWA